LLTFEARENSKPRQGWLPLTAGFANATGDSWNDIGWRIGNQWPGKLYIPWSLGTEEAAWKIGVHFVQTTGFTPEQTWTFRNVPLPPPGSPVAVNRILKRGTTRVRLRSLALARTTAQRWELSHDLQVSPQPFGACFTLFAAHNERGRDITRFGKNAQRFGNEGTFRARHNHNFTVDVPPGTRSVDLTLVLHRSKYITFLAAPELVKAKPGGAAASR
jgi:hypothetical protein